MTAVRWLESLTTVICLCHTDIAPDYMALIHHLFCKKKQNFKNHFIKYQFYYKYSKHPEG